MSYITAALLDQAFERLFATAPGEPLTTVVAIGHRVTRFRVTIDFDVHTVSIPEDELSNAPLDYVVQKYLRPLLDSHLESPTA